MDIKIAGGGLSGLLTAYFIKNNFKKINIEIFEKLKLEKYRIDCAEGLVNQRNSFKILGKLVKQFIVNKLSKVVWIFVLDKDEIRRSEIRNKNFCLMIDRLNFQLSLIKNLEKVGVKINFGEKVEKVEDLDGEIVVDARGSKPGEHCNVAVYKILSGNFEKIKDVNFWTIKDREPETLYWIFPLGKDKANFGCGGKAKMVKLNEFIKFSSDLLNLEIDKCVKKGAGLLDHSYAAMLYQGKEKEVVFDLGKKKVVKVGDSAGLVDPFYGEGISGAALSAYLLSKLDLENYKKLLRKNNEFLKERMAAVIDRIKNFETFMKYMIMLDGVDAKYLKFKPLFILRYPLKFLKIMKEV
ncbi:MAG: NAD(P)/FAD-dependent oxidoreductase [Archaeoglobaceae archaeon]|nr:NAD(P)/FAD-dependent oxidoreductase [Archaeoglobaceae archaeon]